MANNDENTRSLWSVITVSTTTVKTTVTGTLGATLNLLFTERGAIATINAAGTLTSIDEIDIDVNPSDGTSPAEINLDFFPSGHREILEFSESDVKENGTLTANPQYVRWTIPTYPGSPTRLTFKVPPLTPGGDNTWEWEFDPRFSIPPVTPLKIKVKVTRIDPDKKKVAAPHT